MLEELEMLVNNVDVEGYWESGGKLNSDGFNRAREVLSELSNGEKKRSVNDSSLAKVEEMASVSKVPITPGQKYLYAVLREMTGKTEGRSYSPPEKPGTMSPWALTDQRLLAEVIRLTDETNLVPFMRAYPNIFQNDRAAEPQR